jgi:hypothetical protein
MLPMASLRFMGSFVLAITVLIAPWQKATAQTLQQLRNEVRVNDPESVASPDHDRDRDCDDDQHDWDGDGLSDGYSLEDLAGLTIIAGMVVTAPFWVPIGLAEDSPSRPGYFPAFPYQYNVGYMLIHPNEYHGISGPRTPFNWAVRARSDYGTNFSGLSWVGGNVLIESTPRFGIESDFRFYQDDLLTVNNPGPNPDTAWLGDANVFYRFAQSERLQMRSGLGINWLSDRHHTDVGFNFTYAGDYYPIKPWVISGEFDWGVLGDEMLLHTRITTGLQHKGLEAYVGYDLIDIGKFQSNSLIAGVRLWY